MGRIRESAAYAAAEAAEAANAVEAAAKTVLGLLAQFEEDGLTIEIESILGFAIPKTVVQVRLAPQAESEE